MVDKPTYEELEQRVLEFEKTETERKQAEEKLLEPEVRLKALSEASFEAIFLSEKGICLDQNQTAERMFGYTRAEAIGKHGTEWIVPEDHEQVKNNMASGYEKPYEVTALKKDGTTFPCEVQARMTDYQGRSIRITALRDISDRKQAEAALRESEEKYKSLTNNLNVGVYRNSVGSKGNFIEANPAIVKMFGYESREEFLKKGVSNLYKNPHERKEFTSKIAKTGSIKNEVLELQKKDGTVFIGSVSAVAVKNKNGDIKYFDGIIEDVTERKWAEESLKESAQKFRDLFYYHAAVKLIIDPDTGNIVDANEAAGAFYGWSLTQLKKMRIQDINTLSSEQVKAEMEKSKTSKRTHFEFQHLRADGSIRDVEVFSSKVQIRGKTLLHSIIQDITERKQTEEALRESESNLQSVFEAVPVGICFMKDRVYQRANREWCDSFGYLEERLIGKTPEFLYESKEEYERVGKELYGNLLGHGIASVHTKLKRSDEEFRDVVLIAKPLNSQGIEAGTVIVVHDITERKRTEEALRASEEKYRTVMESNPDPMVLYDVDGKVIYLNPAFTRVFGWSLEEQAGKKMDSFVPEKNWPETKMMINKVAVSGETFSGVETRRYTKVGKTLNVSISGSCYRGNKGNITASVINLRDITEQKRLEAQLQQSQKMEAIGALAGGIAHDFNNLLMGIQGRTSIILMHKDSSHPDFGHLREIEGYVGNAADLTKQLLGLARGGKYEVKPTDLNELIRKESRMFGRTKKEIVMREKYEEDIWSVEIDRGQIQQVLLNLYINSWQAMPGSGNLYVETENVTLDENYVRPFSVKPGRYVKISITDTGIGMDKAIQGKIFDPFFTTKEMGRGTGLGLASAYGIIKNHGGFINVYSEKGHGSTFDIYLPASEKEVIEEKKPAGETLRGVETILFVDDEDMITETAEDLLELLGYNVLTAGSGKEAIEIYGENKEQIGIVILDMIMPDMSGGETHDRIKDINPKVKVLLSSGYSINGHATEILKRGCNGFIQKPLRIDELSQKLREILDEE